jgi:hypothetical protein
MELRKIFYFLEPEPEPEVARVIDVPKPWRAPVARMI